MHYNYEKGKLIKIKVELISYDSLSFSYVCPICGKEELFIVKVKNAEKTINQIREYSERKRKIAEIEGIEDNLTAREALISGMCMDCQNEVFNNKEGV